MAGLFSIGKVDVTGMAACVDAAELRMMCVAIEDTASLFPERISCMPKCKLCLHISMECRLF